MPKIAEPCGEMVMRGSGVSAFDTTTTSRPVSGSACAEDATVTAKRAPCAEACVAAAESTTNESSERDAQRVAQRDIRRRMDFDMLVSLERQERRAATA